MILKFSLLPPLLQPAGVSGVPVSDVLYHGDCILLHLFIDIKRMNRFAIPYLPFFLHFNTEALLHMITFN